MTMQGIYIGSSGTTSSVDQMLQSYESWLGKAVDGVAVHTGYKNWSDWSSSIGWAASINSHANATHKIFWSIPLIPRTEATMGAAGSGAYNTKYVSAAQKLLAAEGTGDETIYVRTGWEFNAAWSPVSSSAVGQPQNYINAYRNFVDSFRSVSDRFVFEWTPNIGYDGNLRAEDGYPGDAYVDVIGMDFYWSSTMSWSTQDPLKAWNWNLTQPNGLNWLTQFAAEHGKRIAISEWGVDSNNAAPYIEKALQWFEDHDVLYQTYWESNAAFDGMLSGGQYPATAEAFLKAFGYQGPDLPDVLVEAPVSAAAQTFIKGTSAKETLTGSDRHDSLKGSGGDTLRGGRGDDFYNVTDGDIVVELAGEGTDTVVTWMKSHTLAANVENLILASTGAQIGTGNALANRISGGSGDNILRGMGGDDWITTGGGTDILIFKKGDGHDVVTDFSGTDKVQLLGFGLTSTALATHLFEKNGNTILYLDDDKSITFLGKALADLNLSNISQDVMVGTAANESYLVLNGTESIVEGVGQGIDTIYTHASSYTMAANVENAVLMVQRYLKQTVVGNDLGNVITGGSANDTISGGAGNDVLTGGVGNDALNGGSGMDTFIFKVGNADDSIGDFNAGLGAGDVIRLEGYNFSSFDQIRALMTQSGSHVVLNLGNGDKLTLKYHKLADFVADDFGFNVIIPPASAASLESVVYHTHLALTGLVATLTGNSLNNHMLGSDGDNVLKGGSGNDALYGGLGNDVLYGESGFDVLYGGAGADQFVFQAANALTGLDQLMDFNAAEGDRIVLSDLVIGYDPVTSAISDFVNVTSSGGNSVVSVDRDGAATKYDFKAIALTNGTELADAAILLSHGTLVP